MENAYIPTPTKKYFLWLLEELDKLGIIWNSGCSLKELHNAWGYYKSKTYVVLEGEKLLYGNINYNNYMNTEKEIWDIKHGDVEELRTKLTMYRL